MRKIILFMALILGASILLSGCGTSRIMVLRSDTEKVGKVNSLQVNEVKSEMATISRHALIRIREILIEKLQASHAFDKITTQEGGNIILDVKVIDFEEGDQFTRWFWTGMGGMGAGRIELETTYKEGSSGEEIAQIKTQGTVNTGFFGGSIEAAYYRAVNEIVDYTVNEFGNKK